MTDYMIVSSESRLVLRATILELVAQGWRLQGGVSYDTNRKEFLQAMVKFL